MSGRGRYRNNRSRHHHQPTLSSVAKEAAASLLPDSPVLAMFKQAALQLNERQDRHERLVKLSRDTTIESKRIIFALHSAVTKESSVKAVQDAKERLQKLINGPLKAIGIELQNSPAYLHLRAVTAGFQEFIEALTLCSVMETNDIITYSEVEKLLTYEVQENEESETKEIKTLLPYNEYMLGIADLTGELMRRAINSISSGDSEDCFLACQLVRNLYTGYLGLFGVNKELSRKMSTTRANVTKVEQAVYALKVRGGEAPPTLLLAGPTPGLPDWETNTNHSDDEGFY